MLADTSLAGVAVVLVLTIFSIEFNFNLIFYLVMSLNKGKLTTVDRNRSRPGEKVFNYLNRKYLTSDLVETTRLPTAQELAKQLNVGVSTVQKTYQRLIKEGRLDAAPGRGTFVRGRSSKKRIGICIGEVGDSATEIWQSRINGAIIHAATIAEDTVEIVPFRPSDLAPGRSRVELPDGLDGIIVFPHPELPQLIRCAKDQLVPWVTLHPLHPEETADFVSPNYITGCRLLGRACVESGRRRMALVQAHPAGPSASNFLRSSGFLDSIGYRLGDSIKLRIYDGATASVQTGRAAASTLFAKGGFRPDMVFCMGDFLAHGFLGWLKDNGIPCPEAVSVVSGTGLVHDPDPFPGMTCLRQPLEKLGYELLQFMMRRIERGCPIPGTYIPSFFVGGATTLLSENSLLLSNDPDAN